MIQEIPQKKIALRAEIDFLVGFVASNIWRIWFLWPSEGQRARFVRDVVFDEFRRYSLK